MERRRFQRKVMELSREGMGEGGRRGFKEKGNEGGLLYSASLVQCV